MGPGRLTGMNAALTDPLRYAPRTASMGPGRLTGMNARGEHDRRPRARASMGPGRLTGMNGVKTEWVIDDANGLQWGPVD